MGKFRFYIHREHTQWMKDCYDIEAETLEEAKLKLEEADFDIDHVENAECVEEYEESEKNDESFYLQGPQHVIIEDEEGEEVFDGNI